MIDGISTEEAIQNINEAIRNINKDKSKESKSNLLLKPAQLYRDELNRKLTECWYKPEYQYYFLDCPREFQVPDTTEWRRDFVCVNDKNEIVGYFAYHHDDAARSLSQFGLIAFTDSKIKNGRFISECIAHIENLVDEGLRRLDFWAIADNPVNKMYRKLVDRWCGYVVGRMHECHYFGGKYHDSILYEILF